MLQSECYLVHEACDLFVTQSPAPLKRIKVAADENIRYMRTDETVIFLKLV